VFELPCELRNLIVKKVLGLPVMSKDLLLFSATLPEVPILSCLWAAFALTSDLHAVPGFTGMDPSER